MVEVAPSKGQIQIKYGWMVFTIIGIIVFSLLFYFVPNSGWYWYALGAAAVVALAIDAWYFETPLIVIILIVIGVIATVLVKKFLI